MGEGALFYRGGGTRTEVEKAYTCNLFVRTSAFLRSGGFDEALLNNEDLALCEAVRRDGGRIVYDPEVVVHHHRRDLLHFWLSWFNEGLALPDYGGFRHRGWWLAFLPSVAVIFEACVLALGGLLGWLALQLAQLVVFFIERFARTRSVWLASGAALAMWGFLKAFGVGGLASPFVRRRRVLRSRHDPKTEASFSAPTPGRDERAAVGSGSSSPEAEV
jgi:GT2 family glycosyltransferase